jgi:long-chain acyl-CoA synthetase
MTASIEAKLVDFADAGYFATNKPNPQGEIWLRGPTVLKGYYENDKETAEALTADGWFKTGDIGEWDRNGHLKIIDRKKNLVKTLNGEYIALEKLESIYRSAPVVANICVYADISQAKPIAIIVPAEPALKKLAAAVGAEGEGLEVLVHDKKVQSAVLRELQSAGRAGGLSGIEIVEGVVVVDDEWTPQNVSFLTPPNIIHMSSTDLQSRTWSRPPRSSTAGASSTSTGARLPRRMARARWSWTSARVTRSSEFGGSGQRFCDYYL